MWIDQLTCHENASCNNYDLTPLSSTRCTSTEQAAGVRCEAGQYGLSSAFSKSLYLSHTVLGACYSDGEVRARNRTYSYPDGGFIFTANVEICDNTTYGLVCGSGWSDAEAEVLCKQEAYNPPYYGE